MYLLGAWAIVFSALYVAFTGSGLEIFGISILVTLCGLVGINHEDSRVP